MRVGGIILCGGKSSRMGQAKAWLPVAGMPMLCRIAQTLGEAVQPIVVVSASEQTLPPLPSDVIIAHDEQPDRGPMQGLATGLAIIARHVDTAFVTSCDVPRLQSKFVRRMIDLADGFTLCLPETADGMHPLAGIYSVSLLPEIHAMLARDQLRLLDLLDHGLTRRVRESELRDVDPDLVSLRNINTPEEYAALVREMITPYRDKPATFA